MQAHHDDLLAGHLGWNHTVTIIKHQYWWPHMSSMIATWVATCEQCQHHKAPHQGKSGLLQPIPVASQPFERVHLCRWHQSTWPPQASTSLMNY